MMKKIPKVLLVVLIAILAFKFVTSTFFIWMVIAAALPQIVKFTCKNCCSIGKLSVRLYANRYKYSLIFMAVLPLLGLKIGLVLAAAIGVGVSYLLFENIKAK